MFNGVEIKEENEKVICKRASKDTLHTDGTHTFGNRIVTQKTLKSGDAFDCDVNGNREYNPDTERFYYVTDLDDSTAVLIYYNNVENGKPSNSKLVAYDASGENFHGPRTAIKELPSTSEWRNVSLKNSTRAILNENGGGTLPSNFSYAGYSARLLTTQEIKKVCGITVGNYTHGELDSCNYLMENTKYSSSSLTYGYWIENALSGGSTDAWLVNGNHRYVSSNTADDAGDYGVRPVIEVPKSNIEY